MSVCVEPNDFDEMKNAKRIFNEDKLYRAWCFTLNNYTEEQITSLSSIVKLKCQYIVFGKEVAPTTQMKHLQGFVYFKNATSFSSVKKKFFNAHLEPAIYNQASIKYCKKDDDFVEFGEPPKDNTINQWAEIKEDITLGMDWKELIAKYPESSIKYASGMRMYYEELKPKYRFSILEKYGSFKEWQQALMHDLDKPPDDRKVIWYADVVGNNGKTDMANHLMSENGFKVFGNGKTADIALAWNGENTIFDFSRSQSEHINYGVLEDIKNGRVFSGKYQSTTKFYPRPHVVVFANFEPKYTEMSLDKWDVRFLVPSEN